DDHPMGDGEHPYGPASFDPARRRLIDDMVATGLRNPFMISSDWHSTFVNDVHTDFVDQSSPVVATEIVATAVTAGRPARCPPDARRGPYHRRMRWHDLGERAPRVADLARERLIDPGVLLVATARRDGTPRVSAVEPLVLDGDLWLSMLWQSRKASDLQR